MLVLVFDTETTGLPEERNTSIRQTNKWPHIVQLSYILYDTDALKIVACQDYVVAIPDDVVISEGSQNIHGITKSLCKRKGIPVEMALDDFHERLATADCLVGHNLSFDKRMIMVELIRLGRRQHFSKDGRGVVEYCTMKRTSELCGIERISSNGDTYFKYPTLEELHRKLFGVSPKGTHDSMADVLICLRCYVQLTQLRDIIKDGCPTGKRLFRLYCL